MDVELYLQGSFQAGMHRSWSSRGLAGQMVSCCSTGPHNQALHLSTAPLPLHRGKVVVRSLEVGGLRQVSLKQSVTRSVASGLLVEQGQGCPQS